MDQYTASTKALNLLDSDDEEVETLSQKQIQAVQEQIQKADPFPMEKTKTRNILMLGRSGSGKSTAQEIIKDIAAKPTNTGLFSDTFDPKFASFSLTDLRNTCKYTVNIIDTPGVQEVKRIGEDSRSDEAIMGTVKFCLKNEITKVHCLFIFVSFDGKINKSDKEAFQIYLEMFRNAKVRIGFCITKCEGKTKAEEEHIRAELGQDEYFKGVLELPNVEVFFCGAVNSFVLKNTATEQQLIKHYRDIHKRREILLNYIFAADDEGTMLYDFPIVSKGVSDLDVVFKEVGEIIGQLRAASDFSCGPIKVKITEFCRHVEIMKQNEALFSTQSLYEKFITMKQDVKTLQGKVPQDVWTTLTGPLIM